LATLLGEEDQKIHQLKDTSGPIYVLLSCFLICVPILSSSRYNCALYFLIQKPWSKTCPKTWPKVWPNICLSDGSHKKPMSVVVDIYSWLPGDSPDHPPLKFYVG